MISPLISGVCEKANAALLTPSRQESTKRPKVFVVPPGQPTGRGSLSVENFRVAAIDQKLKRRSHVDGDFWLFSVPLCAFSDELSGADHGV